MTIGGDLVLINAAGWTNDSSEGVALAGDFDNQSTAPSLFDWTDGRLLLNSTDASGQTFEVAGMDLGSKLEGFATDQDAMSDTQSPTNFSIGRLEIASGADVQFVNLTANAVGFGTCDEALYVDTLILGSGTTVTINNCRVYYRSLVDNGAVIETVGCGELVELKPELCFSAPVGSLPGSPPASSLWRSAGNVVRLTFCDDITAPNAGEIEVVEMLVGPAYGTDLSDSFTFEIENDDAGDPKVLKIIEIGSALTPRSWYAILNIGAWTTSSDFEVQWPLQIGDANGDLRVLFNDLGAINSQLGCFSGCGDDNRFDINGDGRILFNDLGAANVFVGSFPVRNPAGH